MKNIRGLKQIFKQFRHNKVLLLMVLPAILFFIMFSYIPMAGSIMAFKEFNVRDGMFFSPWTGFSNFKFLFISNVIWNVVKNTLLYNVAFIITNTLFSITVAILLFELISKVFRKIAQSFMFLPYFISWVIVGSFAYNIMSYDFGVLNSILTSLGVEKVDIYSTQRIWKYILVAFNLWKGIGYGSVLYLATITGIGTDIYEAAHIDGADTFKRIYYIILPMLKPTIIILILLNVGTIFRGNFELFFQLVGNNSLLFKATDVIDTFVVRSLTQSNDIGMASAAAFSQSVMCFITIIIVNAIVKKYSEENALF